MGQDWQEYQAEAAAFFQSLGLTAVAGENVEGARATHEIDVWVTFENYGIEIKWVVECKLWNTPVTKEKVLVLQQIIQDVGADRGLLLSESGFQAGAIQAAKRASITLTSLEELRAHSGCEKAHLELTKINKRYVLLESQLRPLVYSDKGLPFPYHPCIQRETVISTMADLFQIRLVLPKAFAGEFPINTGHADDRSNRISDHTEFLRYAGESLERSQARIEDLVQQVHACHKEAIELAESLADAVESLMEDAEMALFGFLLESSEFESYRLKALESMKEVGRLSGDLKSKADKRIVKETRVLMRLLIATVYLYLSESTIEEGLWEETREAVNEKLDAFREFLANYRDPYHQ